jgi:hypothetical protein
MPSGSIVGCLIAGWMANKIGHKKFIIISGIIWIVGSILQAASINCSMLVASHIISGISVSILMITLDQSTLIWMNCFPDWYLLNNHSSIPIRNPCPCYSWLHSLSATMGHHTGDVRGIIVMNMTFTRTDQQRSQLSIKPTRSQIGCVDQELSQL